MKEQGLERSRQMDPSFHLPEERCGVQLGKMASQVTERQKRRWEHEQDFGHRDSLKSSV